MPASISSTLSRKGSQVGIQNRQLSLPVLAVQVTPSNIDEAGSETVSFLKSLDVLSKKGEKILYDVRFACLKNWFARSAWHEKLYFIMDLLQCCEGTSLLCQLLICIARAGTKDAVFLSYMKSGGSSTDRILMDDNRDLDPETLSNVRILDKMWFLGLEDDDKLTVIIGLLLIGGGILSFRVYREAMRILEERQDMNAILNKTEIVKSTVKNQSEEKEGQNGSQVTEKLKKKTKGKKKKKSRDEKVPITIGSEDSYNVEVEIMNDITEEMELEKEIEIYKAEWEAKLNEMQKSMMDQENVKRKNKNLKKGKGGRDTDKAKEMENIDMLQLLPPSICKAVINMLDPKSMAVAKKVNSYWASVVESTCKDKASRQKLDNIIAKISNIQSPSHLEVPKIPEKSSILSSYFMQDTPLSLSTISQKNSEFSMKSQPDLSGENASRQTREILHPGSGMTTSVSIRNSLFHQTSSIQEYSGVHKFAETLSSCSAPQEVVSSQLNSILHVQSFPSPVYDSVTRHRRISFHDDAIRRSLQLKSIETQAKILELIPISQKSSSEEYKRMYSNKHSITTIINDFLHLRVMDCGSQNRLMAITDEKHNVAFFSLITGARLTPYLTSHKSAIIYMQFHPDGSHIITASLDNTVRCWDIWSGKTVCSYIGHCSKISALSVCEEHLAVGSAEKLLRVYHVWSAYCLDSQHLYEDITALKLLGNGKCVYIGQKNGNILKYNYNTHSVEMNISGHILEVTDLYLAGSLLLSSSYDRFVKVWNIEKPAFRQLLELYHARAVLNVNVVSTQVVSGCHEGYLWIWCLLTGTLIRKLQVWPIAHPIHNIYCADEKDHVKIVVNAEVGVKIYEFHPVLQTKARRAFTSDQDKLKTASKNVIKQMGSKHSVTKHLKPGLKNATLCKDLGQPVRVKLKTQRTRVLDMRGSVDQALRIPMNVPSTKKCFVSELCGNENKIFNPETCNLTSFPRLAMNSKLKKLLLKTQIAQLPIPQKPTKYIKPKRNVNSHKNLIHYYNVQEIRY